MKKTLAFLVTLMLLAAFPALAEEPPQWEMDQWREGVLVKYNGPGGQVVIPAQVDGQAVRILDSRCLNGRADITAVILPEGVEVIAPNAFVGCDSLASVTLPQSLRVIGASAFSFSSPLEELTLPAGVAYIGSNGVDAVKKRIIFEGALPLMDAGMFTYFTAANGREAILAPDDLLQAYQEYFGGHGLIVGSGKNAAQVSLLAPEGDFDFDAATGAITAYNGTAPVLEIPAAIGGVPVRTLGKGVFERSGSLYAVLLPQGLERIEDRAFALCQNPLYVRFPDTLAFIGQEAFESVRFLQAPRLPTSLKTIGQRAFLNLNYEGGAAFELPEGLVEIGDEAFSGASLTDPVLPSTLKRIGNRAFSDANFGYMAINSYVMPQMGEEPFYGRPLKTLADIDLPWDTTRAQWEAAKAIFESMGFENLTVWRNNPAAGGHCVNVDFNDDAVKGAYDKAGFLTAYSGTEADLSVWTSIRWSDVGSVDTIGVGEGAFRGNRVIRTFWPHHTDRFTTISAEAFADSSLELIEMYDSITTVGARAFAGCTGLTQMVLPPFLQSLAADAYAGCTGIAQAVVECDGAVVPSGLFADCAALTAVTFFKGAVPAEILAGKTGVTQVTLTEGVTAIGEGAFRGCTGLTEIELPKTITQIAPDAFAGCTGLTRVVVRCDASALPGGLFKDCAGLAYVSFDRGNISSGVLENCRSLTTLALGDEVTGIGARAFANTGLSGFVIPANIPVDYTAFAGVENLYLDVSATDAQVAQCSQALGYPWYNSITRVGEESRFIKMPFEPTPAERFDFDPETGTIRKFLGDEVDVVVPRTINGVTVREIAYGAFDRCSDYTGFDIATNRTEWVPLRSVVLPETVETMGDMLFGYCQQLETFICYAPLETTGKSVFTGCTSLNNVIFVNGVKQIDNSCFELAGPLGNLWLGDQLERIGIWAFSNTQAKTLTLDAVFIDSGAVTACSELTELHFGSRVEKFGDMAAQDCPKLNVVCLEMPHAEGKIPSGMLLARLAEKVTLRLPETATEADVRDAGHAPFFAAPMELNIVCQPCTRERPPMTDPSALLGIPVLPVLTATPAARVTPAPRPTLPPVATPEPIPAPTAAPLPSPALNNLQSTKSTMNSNGTALFTVWTNTGVRFLALFDEAGVKLRVYDAASFAIAEEEGLTWYVPYPFGAEGKYTVYFDGSADGEAYTGERRKITATIDPADGVGTDVPAVSGVSTKPMPAFRFANTYLTVRTGNNARFLSAYDEAGNLLETWEPEGNVTSWKGELVWHIFYQFQQDGRREIVFKASADGENYGTEKKAYITVRYAPKPAAAAQPVTQPVAAPTAQPVVDPAVQATAQPVIAPEVQPAESVIQPAIGGEPAAEGWMGVRFVCTEVEYQGGIRLPASSLGQEYSMVLHEDGRMTCVMGGMDIPTTGWVKRMVETPTGEAQGFVFKFYSEYGPENLVIMTEKGLEMNYMDAMYLYYAPETK